ncbi:MAG: glycosyltransferase [Acidobacteriota bacterium]|jgi:glycosyltransferase involved in cell wall biosynthesis
MPQGRFGGGPRVSVVMPAWNAAATIREAIGSVLDGSFQDVEVIVVDDESTDGTVASVEAFGAPVRLLRQSSRGGPSAARNRAIGEARGELVAFLDADDLWHPDKLEHQVAHLDAAPDVDLVYTNVWNTDGETFLPMNRAARRVARTGNVYAALFHENFIVTSSVLVRRSALSDVGGFDESLTISEDFDLWLRIARRHRVGFVDRPLTFYRMQEGSAFSDLERRLAARERILEKALREGGEGTPSSAEIRQLIAALTYRMGVLHARSGDWDRARDLFRKAGGRGSSRARMASFLSRLPTGLREPLRRLRTRLVVREYDLDVLIPDAVRSTTGRALPDRGTVS